MTEVTLSVEQMEQIKQQLLMEIKLKNAKKWQRELIAVERKYHKQLTSINGGSVWTVIQRIVAYRFGYKYTRYIPDEEVEAAAKMAEELCQEIIAAFNKEGIR